MDAPSTRSFISTRRRSPRKLHCYPFITARRAPMAIKIGDHLPNSTFRVMTAEGPAARSTDDIFKGRKVVLFGVPGAFTPTCHNNHLAGFLAKAEAIKAKGIDAVAVTGVNDVF